MSFNLINVMDGCLCLCMEWDFQLCLLDGSVIMTYLLGLASSVFIHVYTESILGRFWFSFYLLFVCHVASLSMACCGTWYLCYKILMVWFWYDKRFLCFLVRDV